MQTKPRRKRRIRNLDAWRGPIATARMMSKLTPEQVPVFAAQLRSIADACELWAAMLASNPQQRN